MGHLDLTEAGKRAWNVVSGLVRPDGSLFVIIEDEVLRQADVSTGHVREAIKVMLGDPMTRLESVEIGLPGTSRPGFLLQVSARPTPQPAPQPTPGANAVHDTIGPVDETKFKRIAELIAIARWHIPYGDRDNRTKVVEEAEIELRFARRESDMLAEELAKPRPDTRAELIVKLERERDESFKRAGRIAVEAMKKGESIPESAQRATAKGQALANIVNGLKYEAMQQAGEQAN